MASMNGLFDCTTTEKIKETKLFIVGAGGIGCELLKTAILSGFEDIHIIDLDTIDLSNLNRQFLFHKQHIGQSKALVAKQSVVKFNPNAKIEAIHDSVTSPKYDVEFYRQFTCVANALDNIAARSHVNRMCIAADVPLVESGSAGYLGQTTVYKKKITECFECLPRKGQRVYPSCTIRNTPSEPVHCIVWSKHLFNQLFGESDDNEDEVSPDVSEVSDNETVAEKPISTRELAKSTNFSSLELFNKLFNKDIKYLLRLHHLWEKRSPPVPLDFDKLTDAVPSSSRSKESEIQDFRLWSLKKCGEVFVKSLNALRKRVEDGGPDTALVWDKDDDVCLDFVVACSNLRCANFRIEQKNRFDVKAIAGNIIPAIATTNAVVGGLIVLQILKVIKGDFTACRSSWINESYLSTHKLISACELAKPNPNCWVCSTDRVEVEIAVNLKEFTVKALEEKILKEKLHMVQPDAILVGDVAKVLVSSDPDEQSDTLYAQTLNTFLGDAEAKECILNCEDFVQNFNVRVVLIQDNDLGLNELTIKSDLDLDNIQAKETDKASGDTTSSDKRSHDGSVIPHDEDLDLIEEIPEDPDIEIDIITDNDDENGVEPPSKKIKL